MKHFATILTAVSRSVQTPESTAFAQGTFLYDQQSSNEGVPGEGAADIQTSQPLGQSFIPLFSGIDFVRLRIIRNFFGTAGASIAVNLRATSITGTILSTSLPSTVPAGFIGYTDFLFPSSVSLAPGTTYFFQPVLQSGDAFAVGYHNGFGYANGAAIFQGTLNQFNNDLWFREGLFVP
jgi:hypothetical protein